MCTHEEFVRTIAEYVKETAPDEKDRHRLDQCKLVYGAGQPGLRGVTYYDQWQTADNDHIALVEVCAMGESDPVQIAGTTIHELAHVIAGVSCGHDGAWKKTCERLGLRKAKAAGMRYVPAALRPDIRELVWKLGIPTDGKPNGKSGFSGGLMLPKAPKPCPMGIGTRGGNSRGKGSGSRLVKASCESCNFVARISRKWLDIMPSPTVCPVCEARTFDEE